MNKEEMMEATKEMMDAASLAWDRGFKAGYEYAMRKVTEELEALSKEVEFVVLSRKLKPDMFRRES